MRYSAALIIPAALKTDADAVGAAMGWGPESYTIPIPEPEAPTHYGLRADVSEQFIRWIKGLEPLPDPSAQPVIDALIWDFSPDPTVEYVEDEPVPRTLWGKAHFDAAVTRAGLRPVEAEDDD